MSIEWVYCLFTIKESVKRCLKNALMLFRQSFKLEDLILLGGFFIVAGGLILVEWPVQVIIDPEYESQAYIDGNPFEIKNDIIKEKKVVVSLCFTILGGILLGLLVYFKKLRLPSQKFVRKAIVCCLFTSFLFWFSIEMVEWRARVAYLPKILFSQANLFFRTKYIIENEGLYPDESEKQKQGIGMVDSVKSKRLKEASENLDIIGKLLDCPREEKMDLPYYLKKLTTYRYYKTSPCFAGFGFPDWYFIYQLFHPDQEILTKVIVPTSDKEKILKLADYFVEKYKGRNNVKIDIWDSYRALEDARIPLESIPYIPDPEPGTYAIPGGKFRGGIPLTQDKPRISKDSYLFTSNHNLVHIETVDSELKLFQNDSIVKDPPVKTIFRPEPAVPKEEAEYIKRKLKELGR